MNEMKFNECHVYITGLVGLGLAFAGRQAMKK